MGLKIFEFLTPKKLTKNREKNRKLFLAQNCLNQLLDNTKKKTKNREIKIKKLIFGSELSEDFLIFDTKKNIKKSRKNSKNYFWPKIIS